MYLPIGTPPKRASAPVESGVLSLAQVLGVDDADRSPRSRDRSVGSQYRDGAGDAGPLGADHLGQPLMGDLDDSRPVVTEQIGSDPRFDRSAETDRHPLVGHLEAPQGLDHPSQADPGVHGQGVHRASALETQGLHRRHRQSGRGVDATAKHRIIADHLTWTDRGEVDSGPDSLTNDAHRAGADQITGVGVGPLLVDAGTAAEAGDLAHTLEGLEILHGEWNVPRVPELAGGPQEVVLWHGVLPSRRVCPDSESVSMATASTDTNFTRQLRVVRYEPLITCPQPAYGSKGDAKQSLATGHLPRGKRRRAVFDRNRPGIGCHRGRTPRRTGHLHRSAPDERSGTIHLERSISGTGRSRPRLVHRFVRRPGDHRGVRLGRSKGRVLRARRLLGASRTIIHDAWNPGTGGIAGLSPV